MSMIGKTLFPYKITVEIGTGGVWDAYWMDEWKPDRDFRTKILTE